VALFLSTYINKIDRKGRVSVPASFRAALVGQAFPGVVAYRALKLPAVEASGIDRVEELSDRIDALPDFSDERDALASILPDSQQLPFDSEGRVILPPALVQHAGIGENAAFVGLGRTFQIWDPTRFARHQDDMRERALQRGLTLPARGTPAK
jgi:MraZ protein